MPETATIIPERLAALATLAKGQHDIPADGMCAVEAAAWIAGEGFSDHPSCVSPVIAAFCRSWNDDLPQADRNRLLLPLVPRIVGTDGSSALEVRRSLMAADWLVREHTPAWLRLAGLSAQADMLEALPEITSMAQVPSIRGPLEAVKRDADAAGAAARAAAGATAWAPAGAAARAAAGAAAGDAAWAPAGAAAGAAARAAAWAAAGAAAGDAARAAAGAKLAPTKTALQQSALRLIERMIEARDAA